MKKKIILFLLPLLVFIGVGFAPQFLKLDRVKEKITTELRNKLGDDVRTEEIRWHWLPLPYFTLHETKFISGRFELALPEAIVRPRWSSLLSNQFSIKEITLTSPLIHVKNDEPGSWQKNTSLPTTKIIVKFGTLSFDGGAAIPGISFPKPMQFSIAHSEINIEPTLVHFYGKGSSSFVDNFNIIGEVNVKQNAYKVKIDTNRLQLHKSGAVFADGHIVPTESPSNVSIRVDGSGTNSVTAKVTGDFPSFIAKRQERELSLKCGAVDFVITKKGKDISVVFSRFEIKKPGLTLSGSIGRELSANSAGNPTWRLDLEAVDLNLTEIRESILGMWGDHKVAQKVLHIVRGGRATAGGYAFAGTVEDFRLLQKMTITADVLSASIHVPAADLDLARAKGEILIKDGLLTGDDLSAGLGSSRGRNCSLQLDLLEDTHSFGLEIDIEADLSELPGVLKTLVKHDGFQKELDNFHKIRGRASGHLSIGDTLTAPVVRVSAHDIDATLNYSRIPWPIAVQQGTFKLSPQKASWRKVQAQIGPHAIEAIGGTVTWDTKPYITIDLKSATIDSNALFSELTELPFFPDKIKENITLIQGTLDIQGAQLEGPAHSPRAWVYQLKTSAERIQWVTPRLPSFITLENLESIINNQGVILTRSTVNFLGQPFGIEGSFTHKLFKEWSGRLTVDGTVDSEVGGWLRRKNWIPATYFPRLPCTLYNFNIAWDRNSKEFTGHVLAGDGQQQTPSLALHIKTADNQLQTLEAAFTDKNRQGTFTLTSDTSSKDYQYNWQGELDAATLSAFFEKNTLINGLIKGNFQLNTGRASQPSFLGNLLGTDIRWRQDNAPHDKATVSFNIHGKDQLLALDNLTLNIKGNTHTVNGQLTSVGENLVAGLTLEAPQTSQRDLSDFLADLKKQTSKLAPRPIRQGQDGHFSGWDLTGDLHFNIQKFAVTRKSSIPDLDLPPTVHIVQPAIGHLEMLSGKNFNIHISSSELCGVSLSGTLYASDILGEDDFHLTTPNPLNFEEVLPCMGIIQDVVIGSFTMQGNLKGRPGQWMSGAVDIFSEKGRILRMRVLSQIFSLINVTDLFNTNELEIEQEGFAYSQLDFQTTIRDNQLETKRAVIRGEGLNLFARGNLDLITLHSDFTVLIAPLKTIDSVLGNVPFIGRAFGGKDAAIVTIPVGVKGNIKNPEVTLLPPEAVGEGIVNLVTETLKIPFKILAPILSKDAPDATR